MDDEESSECDGGVANRNATCLSIDGMLGNSPYCQRFVVLCKTPFGEAVPNA